MVKKRCVLDGLVNSSDRTEIYAKVRILPKEKEGYLALVVHGRSGEEACILLLEESEDRSMPPRVLDLMPLYADTQVEIAQSNGTSPELVVRLSLGQERMEAVFPEKEVMAEVVLEIKRWIQLAQEQDWTATGDTWTEAYRQFTRPHRPVARANTAPIQVSHALRYVVPLQREDTLAKIELKRTRTVTSGRERELNVREAKDHWVNAQLMKREDEFVSWEPVTAFIGTWNVHGSLPTQEIQRWLQQTESPDFYVLGLQEMETNTEAYIRYDPTKENAWVQGVLEALNLDGEEYVKVASKQLVTLLLIVISKQKHGRFISETQVTWAGVGLMNMMGNKGGISVRLRFHDSYLCFVTSHLAAFTDKTEKRNQDFLELSKRLLFSHTPSRLTRYVSYFWNHGEGVSFLENHGVLRDWRVEASIYHSDVLIWCGDLNYRINQTEAVIKHWLREQRLDVLLAYDQLSIEKRAGRTFQMFDEGEITFPPTYKYDPGTDQYDTSEKRRAPSWTDRILWKKERAESGSRLRLLEYSACGELKKSDHKPVKALMRIGIRKIDSRLLEKTRSELEQQLKEHREIQPRGKISSSFVDFEGVQFLEYKEKTLWLENTGQVMVLFRFLPNPMQTRLLPPWLQVSPTSGVLAPGESVVLRFELMVDPTLSTPLNLGYEELEETLILRLENASDFFICVSGHYQPTCFGVPLNLLAEMSLPVCAEAEKNLLLKKDGLLPPEPVPVSARELPQELSKIMNFLWNTNMFRIPSLFLEHGDLSTSTFIRQCLDDGHPLDTSLLDPLESLSLDEKPSLDREAISANSMIDVLVAFLDCLPDPVIPTELYERALEASGSVEAIQTLKESLPPLHEKVLSNLAMFLRHAIDLAPHAVQKKREVKIVETFTVLLRAPVDFKERNPVVAKEKRENFVSQLLKSLK